MNKLKDKIDMLTTIKETFKDLGISIIKIIFIQMFEIKVHWLL